MPVLEIHELKYYIQNRLLLDLSQLKVFENDRIGLIGRNGSGKTTLLQALSGKMNTSKRNISQHVQVELLPQLKQVETVKSGGEVTQDYVQQALMSQAGLLLADEPTTHLDLTHIKWVEEKLREWHGALIIVSHDRAFLDALCTSIWELDKGKVKIYKGNYTDYTTQKEIELNQAAQAFDMYQQEKKHLIEAMRQKEEAAKRATKKPKHLSSSEARIKGTKTYYSNKQKKLRKSVKAIKSRLDSLDEVKKVTELPPIKMDLPHSRRFKNKVILRADHVEGRINDRILFKSANFYMHGGDKLAIIGENGSGKTTLIKKIMAREKGITLSSAVKIGYFAQDLNILNEEKSILENVQSSSSHDQTLIRTVLARMHFFEDDVYKPVKVLSGGERVRVALSKVFVSDVNVLVLDEPTNFLDIESLEALESLLSSYEGSLIVISHDREFINGIANCLLEIRDQELHYFKGTYQAYQSRKGQVDSDTGETDLLLLETKITDVLSRLSIEPTDALEKEFQELMKKKRGLKAKE